MKKEIVGFITALACLSFSCVSTSSSGASFDTVYYSDGTVEKSSAGTTTGNNKENNYRGKGLRITVPSPTYKGSSQSDNWIPQLIQDLLTSNFAEYSEMTVIDRANEEVILNEQRHSESEMFSDADAIELGNITNAQYVVASNIIKAGNIYSISFRILDTSTNEVRASYNNTFTIESIQMGQATKNATKELLPQLGITLTGIEIANLGNQSGNTAEQKRIQSSVNLAKGMAAESKNKNIVEALSYYAESGNNEAEYRFNQLSSYVQTGNIREDAKNEILLRKAWLKSYEDLQKYLNNHLIDISYDVTPGEQKINFKNETVSIPFSGYWEINETAFTIYSKIADGLQATGKKDSWRSSNSDFEIEIPEYTVRFVLMNDAGKVLGVCDKELVVRRAFGRYEYDRKRMDEALANTSDYIFKFTNIGSSSDVTNKFEIKFEGINISDITDNLNLFIERINVNQTRKYNRTTGEYDYIAEIVNPPLNVSVIGQNDGVAGDGIVPIATPEPYKDFKYKVGDIGPAGGRVIWTDRKGTEVNGKTYHYMEVCPVIFGATDKNKDFARSTSITAGRRGTVQKIDNFVVNHKKIGAGIEATNHLLDMAKREGLSGSLSAVTNCNYGGYSDWYIPVNEEQYLISSYIYWAGSNVISRGRYLKRIFTFAGAISYDGSSWQSDTQYEPPFAGKGSYDGYHDYFKYESFMLVRLF